MSEYLRVHQAFLNMPHERRMGHLRCLHDNVTRGVVTPVFARALRDACSAHSDPMTGTTAHTKQTRNQQHEHEEDPRVRSGTHRVEIVHERCGGKGQTIRVKHVVACEQED